jgi:mitogen-activated protein kinase organizer 1
MHIYRDGHIHAVSAVASHDTTMVSASGKSLVVTDMVTAKVKHRISASHTGRVNDVDIRQEAIYLSASYDGSCKLWDARNLKTQTPIQSCDEAKDSVTCVQMDGPHSFYTTSVDGYIRLYDIRQGRVTSCNVGAPIVSMAIADDCVVVSCLDGTLRLVDKELGELLNTYYGAHKASQYAVACAITFRHVMTGSESGPCSALYDLVTAKVVQQLRDPESVGPTCAVAAQDKCLITASFHGKAPLVWTNDVSQISRD